MNFGMAFAQAAFSLESMADGAVRSYHPTARRLAVVSEIYGWWARRLWDMPYNVVSLGLVNVDDEDQYEAYKVSAEALYKAVAACIYGTAKDVRGQVVRVVGIERLFLTPLVKAELQASRGVLHDTFAFVKALLEGGETPQTYVCMACGVAVGEEAKQCPVCGSGRNRFINGWWDA